MVKNKLWDIRSEIRPHSRDFPDYHQVMVVMVLGVIGCQRVASQGVVRYQNVLYFLQEMDNTFTLTRTVSW